MIEQLTEEEQEVLCMVTYPNKQIALFLGTTRHVVKHILTEIYRKLLIREGRKKGARIRALNVALTNNFIELNDVWRGDARWNN